MVEDQSVPSESLPADVEVPSSEPAPQETSEQAPPSPSQTPEEQKVPFQRFESVIREKQALAEQNRQLLDTLQRAIPQQTVAPDVDPYAGMDAPTAQFYRDMDKRIEQKAGQIAAYRMQPLEQAYYLGRQQLVQVTLKDFYKENPDIVPNSNEAMAIAGYIQQYPTLSLEEAKNIVMAPKYAQQARESTQRSTNKTTQSTQKRQLAPEGGAGIPSTSGLPATPRSFRETLQAELDGG